VLLCTHAERTIKRAGRAFCSPRSFLYKTVFHIQEQFGKHNSCEWKTPKTRCHHYVSFQGVGRSGYLPVKHGTKEKAPFFKAEPFFAS
jgi:hypothetical protein